MVYAVKVHLLLGVVPVVEGLGWLRTGQSALSPSPGGSGPYSWSLMALGSWGSRGDARGDARQQWGLRWGHSG